MSGNGVTVNTRNVLLRAIGLTGGFAVIITSLLTGRDGNAIAFGSGVILGILATWD